MDLWFDGEMTGKNLEGSPCRHGEENRNLCVICKNEDVKAREIVYFTGGGMHYHRTAECKALAEGQKIVIDRGGTPSEIEWGYLDVLQLKRKPCKTCKR